MLCEGDNRRLKLVDGLLIVHEMNYKERHYIQDYVWYLFKLVHYEGLDQVHVFSETDVNIPSL